MDICSALFRSGAVSETADTAWLWIEVVVSVVHRNGLKVPLLVSVSRFREQILAVPPHHINIIRESETDVSTQS